jgi:hypothetical protein
MSLLASTSLGVESANTVRAEVRAHTALSDRRTYRLVVHSYQDEGASRAGARPVGSVQRAVTAQELRQGVQVSLLELASPRTDAHIVAWVEAGEPDLEFDGRMARPRPGSMVGSGRGNGDVQIVLGKRAA